MGIWFLAKGVLIGLAIAAPLGPISMLCMHRALTEGPRAGFICGLGAALADAVQAIAGAIALGVIGRWLVNDPTTLRVIGGVYLVYLGARTFLRPTLALPPIGKGPGLQPGTKAAFFISFRLTLANPTTLLGFAAMFAGLGVAAVGQLSAADAAAAALVLGVFLGSTLWWLAMSHLIGRFRSRIGALTLTVINRLCGTVLTAFGLYAIATLLPLL